MSTDPTKVSAARAEDPVSEQTPAREPVKRIDEGLGVFRALILMLIFYLAAASVLWFAWHAWRYWHPY